MNVDEIKKRVQKIREMSDDDESAHSAEDALYTSVLYAIANGADDPAELAREAIKAGDISFSRWCA